MATATDDEKASWPPPNFVNPESRHGLVIGLTAPTLTLAVIFLAVRFYGKGLLRQNVGIDDYVMLSAIVGHQLGRLTLAPLISLRIFAIPVSIFPLVCLNVGLGLHIWDQKPEWYTPYNKMGYAADILFPMACSLTKISLCLTYLRLFPNRSTKIFCYTMCTFVTLYTIACVFLSLFQCRPISGYWDINVEQKCINMRATLVVIAALNSFSDFVIYLWPAKPLWSLMLPFKQRLGLIFLFSVGLIVCIAGVLRMYYLEVYFQSFDLLWNSAFVWSFMILEMDAGIICGCLSGVKPVMAVVFPALFGSSYKTRSGPTRPTYGQTGRTTGPESFAFQPLSDLSSKSRENRIESLPIDAIGDTGGKNQRNFAWASSNGRLDVASRLPANAIGVSQVVTVEEEDSGVVTPRSERDIKANGLSDAGSEEWIIEGPKAHRIS